MGIARPGMYGNGWSSVDGAGTFVAAPELRDADAAKLAIAKPAT